jgi:hypothetical protein
MTVIMAIRSLFVAVSSLLPSLEFRFHTVALGPRRIFSRSKTLCLLNLHYQFFWCISIRRRCVEAASSALYLTDQIQTSRVHIFVLKGTLHRLTLVRALLNQYFVLGQSRVIEVQDCWKWIGYVFSVCRRHTFLNLNNKGKAILI